MDFRIVGQYFFAVAAPPPNVYFPDESVCSASPAIFKCDISVKYNRNYFYEATRKKESSIEIAKKIRI